MSLTINSNIAAKSAARYLRTSSTKLGTTYQRLSSGLRINSAKDDAAGMKIASNMTSKIRGMNQAIRNANDAISMLQVTEGALNETASALQRMRELVVQASSGTNSSSDRGDIWEEAVQLAEEIDRISLNTQFNGQYLLLGSTMADSGVRVQVGAETGSGQTMYFTIGAMNLSAIGVRGTTDKSFYGAYSLGGGSTGNTDTTVLSTADQLSYMNSMISRLDSALSSVSDLRSQLGAVQNRMESTIANLANISENTEAARSRIMDADIAQETTNLTRNSILQQAGTAILAQANQQPALALSLLG